MSNKRNLCEKLHFFSVEIYYENTLVPTQNYTTI